MTDEKRPTATVAKVALGDTLSLIESRWSKQHELLMMIGFWLEIPAADQNLIAEIFCDSNAGATCSLPDDLPF